jgi:hypothetical protein
LHTRGVEKLRKEDIVGYLICVGMWLFYVFIVIFSDAVSVPIWTVGGILLLLGFIALAVIFAILTFALIFT